METPRPRNRARNGEPLIMHPFVRPFELFAMAVGAVICVMAGAIVAAFVLAAAADIIHQVPTALVYGVSSQPRHSWHHRSNRLTPSHSKPFKYSRNGWRVFFRAAPSIAALIASTLNDTANSTPMRLR